MKSAEQKSDRTEDYRLGAGSLIKSKPADVFVAGMGTVGSELLRQIEPGTPLSKAFRLIGFCNTKLALLNEKGVQQTAFANSLMNPRPVFSTRWDKLAEQLIRIQSEKEGPLVFVDATGAREVALLYIKLLDAGIHVVTPSKLANTMPQNYYDELVKERSNGALFRYESAAGAGLPVVHTIRTMVNNGDHITKISGVLSGTMTYLFNQLENGIPFSKAVKLAYESGFTEPDPRDDLSGEDVARKCLILARTAGIRTERETFEAENQTPAALKDVNLKDFFSGLEEYDAFWNQKVADAQKNSCVLRYVSTVERDNISVGVQAVPADSPLGTLRGADNQVSIWSRYYNQSPLLIQGPGAGKEVTAQGVLADMRGIVNGE